MNHTSSKVLICCIAAIIIAFIGCSPDENPPTGLPAYTRSDLAKQLPISLEGSLQNPAWSPDGKAIVFTRFQNGYNKGPADLVIYDLESRKSTILVSDGTDNINLPGSTWNPITNQIIFSSSREPHDEIYIINPVENPNTEIKITNREDRVAYEPSFSSDGHWIIFESHEVDIETNGIITKYKTDGTEPFQALTGLQDDCRQPNWSQNGQYILFQMVYNGKWEIWIMNSDGTNQHQLTTGAGEKTDASFSPDDKWIIYSGDSPTLNLANLFIMPTSGGKPIQVTHFKGYDGAPSWSRNGKQIAFESSPDEPENSSGTTIWMINAPEEYNQSNSKD